MHGKHLVLSLRFRRGRTLYQAVSGSPTAASSSCCFMNGLVHFNLRLVWMLIGMDFINGWGHEGKKAGQVKTEVLGAKEGECHGRVLFAPTIQDGEAGLWSSREASSMLPGCQ